MLREPHIARLTAFAEKLRGRDRVPYFDPLDGGDEARALFLLEKPGLMTEESGFISRNNDDPTAENIFKFMCKARIPRKQTIIWNVVPWWNDIRKVTAQELRDGVESLKELMSILRSLRVVVMVGKKAARAKPLLKTQRLELFTSSHPSPIVKATNRKLWDAIPSEWRKILSHLDIGA